MSAARQTALQPLLERHGGTFIEWGGWSWMWDAGDVEGEYWATRRDAGVWDQPALPKWRFAGPDALAAADRISTNALADLAPGAVRYSPYCDEQGRVISDLVAFAWSAQEAWLMPTLELDDAHLALATDGLDVEATRITDDYCNLQVQGPRSRELVGALCADDISQLAYYRFLPRETTVGGAPCFLSRTAYSGEQAIELFCRPDAAPAALEAVLAAGARPFGLAALEPHRIESGLLFIGREYEPRTVLPSALNLDRFVKLDAGDFIGRDALRTAPDPERRIATLLVAGETLPELGAAVHCGDEQVGTLTSVCHSPLFEQIVGLAMIDVARAVPGTQLTVEVAGAPVAATAERHPYLDPERHRPRGLA